MRLGFNVLQLHFKCGLLKRKNYLLWVTILYPAYDARKGPKPSWGRSWKTHCIRRKLGWGWVELLASIKTGKRWQTEGWERQEIKGPKWWFEVLGVSESGCDRFGNEHTWTERGGKGLGRAWQRRRRCTMSRGWGVHVSIGGGGMRRLYEYPHSQARRRVWLDAYIRQSPGPMQVKGK